MTRDKPTDAIPDDIGFCPRCRFYVEHGHVCNDIAEGNVWPPKRCPARDDMGPDFAAVCGDGPGWIACEHPERPPDEHMSSFPNDCDACAIATEAALHVPYDPGRDGPF